jgi:hypothetical protein
MQQQGMGVVRFMIPFNTTAAPTRKALSLDHDLAKFSNSPRKK